MHNLPESAKPITYGWQFSTVVSLPEKPSSGIYVLDQRRVATATTAIQVAAEQLQELASHVPKETIALLDRGIVQGFVQKWAIWGERIER